MKSDFERERERERERFCCVQYIMYIHKGEKGEEPSDDCSGMRSCKAIGAPHGQVMSAGKNGSQSHHGSDQRKQQKIPSRSVA